MIENLVTTDMILDFFRGAVQRKDPLDAHTWVNGAMRLNMLVSEDHDRLFAKEQMLATMRAGLLTEGKTASYAKLMVEATDDYREMQTLKAKIKRIEEMIRLAKTQARLKDAELRGYT